jgi:hypothetical protein
MPSEKQRRSSEEEHKECSEGCQTPLSGGTVTKYGYKLQCCTKFAVERWPRG